MNTFVVIPTYNEVKTIGGIVRDLCAKEFRVAVVDDGSSDQTIIEANRFGAELIIHSKNVGKGRCIREGLEYALDNDCDVVITMDGDGQHDIKEIDNFIGQYQNTRADIIFGNRMHNPQKMPFLRRCTNVFMSFVISFILGERIEDSQCGYRLLSRSAIEKMKLRTEKYEVDSEMFLEAKRHNLTISSIEISSIYQGQASQINPFFDTLRFIKFITYELLRRKL